MSAIRPHGLFTVWSPDQVAECIDGIPQELYVRLWDIVPEYDDKPRSEVPDDFEERCLARWWDRFTEGEQLLLNDLATRDEGP